VALTDVRIGYTHVGDATMDSLIGIDDYLQLDAAFLRNVPNPTWVNGDFNYDGIVDYKDYALLDNAYMLQNAPQAASEIAAHTAEFGVPYLAALQATGSAVPEPASLLMLAVGVSMTLARRRDTPIDILKKV